MLTEYAVGNSTMTCKVGFLPQHLAVRANAYDGLYACIISIYSNCCTNVLKREKFLAKKGLLRYLHARQSSGAFNLFF